MEDFLLLSYREHLTLQQQKRSLESSYNVKINMPEVKSNDSCGADEISFISIYGDKNNIKSVKNMLKKKNSELPQDNVSIITLSSDSESEHLKPENKSHKRKKGRKVRRKGPDISVEIVNDCNELCEKNKKDDSLCNESVIILEDSEAKDFIPLGSFNTDVKRHKSNQSVIIEKELDQPKDFIPLVSFDANANKHKITSSKSSSDSDIVEISSDEEDNSSMKLSVSPKPRKLRPIVIDGSNVARAHGKSTNTYSCKGIKISVEYFLKRGHTEVVAFVPKYRQHCKRGPIISTNPEILEELELSNNVVFTPSRRLNGKGYSCYDDRFIVQYAATNNGAILSNDNYKDLIDEKPEFKETIEKRLLMFCFVGDTLMIPDDPLGQSGPNLNEFLSFPADD